MFFTSNKQLIFFTLHLNIKLNTKKKAPPFRMDAYVIQQSEASYLCEAIGNVSPSGAVDD